MLSIDNRDKKSTLYWIGLAEKSDIFTQGYIGFTCEPLKKRWCRHLWDAKKNSQNVVHKAIRKYGKEKIVFKAICVGSADYCLNMERKLRPSRNIGWNICIGGGAPGLGKKMSEENKMRLSALAKGRVWSAESRKKVSESQMGRVATIESRKRMSDSAKARGFSDSHKANISLAKKGVKSTNGAWLHPGADHLKWTLAGQYYDLFMHGFGRIPSSVMLGYNGDGFKQILKRIKLGWNPWLDESFLSWKNSSLRKV